MTAGETGFAAAGAKWAALSWPGPPQSGAERWNCRKRRRPRRIAL